MRPGCTAWSRSCLQPDGAFLVSVREGVGERWEIGESGNPYYLVLWSAVEFRNRLNHAGLEIDWSPEPRQRGQRVADPAGPKADDWRIRGDRLCIAVTSRRPGSLVGPGRHLEGALPLISRRGLVEPSRDELLVSLSRYARSARQNVRER